tara:strand:+ start:127 stop:948 length:822 start_codon:yes stop_codon:yes gene_type:complete
MDQMKLVIGMPWYDGPDVSCFARHIDFFMYLSELRSRTIVYNKLGEDYWKIDWPKLGDEDEEAEPTKEDFERLGVLEIGLIDYSRTSLPGKARELICEMALGWDADYIMMWDDDMLFDKSSFLKLFRHDVPVVAALAFAAREPHQPVIMTIKEDVASTGQKMMRSDVVLDYPEDSLITNKDVGGAIAFGTGVFLMKGEVLKQVPQPWFESTGAGEDFFFCTKCHEHGVQRYVDTATKTQHKKYEPHWVDEQYYKKFKELNPQAFDRFIGKEAV